MVEMIQVEVNQHLELLDDINPFFQKNGVKILVNFLQRSKERLKNEFK